MQQGRGWRAITIVGATILLMLAVAFASRPVQLASAGGAGNASITRVLGDVGLYLLLVLLAVMVAFTIWALWPDRNHRPAAVRRPWWEKLIPYVALLVMLGLAVILLRNPRVLHRLQKSTLAQLMMGLQNGRPGARVSTAHTAAAGPDWTAMAIVAVIVGAVVALMIWRWQAARRRRRTPQELARELEEVLDTGLARLGSEAEAPLDAREAVIAAWAGFERVLARGGVPVRAGEAPHEYLTRALGELSLALDARALRSFTDLFEWARYSTNPVTEAMRDQAVAALRAVRDSVHRQAVPDLHVLPA